ncbi:MAG TPA: hypothetical protein VH061_02405 [Solirubrobacteraceae bacterium]|jgi:Tfp pilus assembly protein PilN|nr:hypothetical protein [Solirubrobacteraceae bacterium]
MRAVNLIPGDQRDGSPVGAGRSEGAAYAVLAVLAAFAVLAVLYGKASRDVSSDKSKAATLTAEAQSAQAQASTLAPYTTFASLREQRAQAVASLVDTRFDWAHAFHEFGRVLTGETSISSLDGSIAPGIAAPAAATTPAPTTTTPTTTTTSTTATTAASSVTSATPSGSVPTFQLAGCATSQRTVAQMLQRLRLIDGVDEVTLQSSTKGASSGGGSGGCPPGGPAFNVTVTFDALPSATAAAAAATGKAKTVAAQSSSASTAAPATTSTSTTGGVDQ